MYTEQELTDEIRRLRGLLVAICAGELKPSLAMKAMLAFQLPEDKATHQSIASCWHVPR